MRFTRTVTGLPCYYLSSSDLVAPDQKSGTGKYGMHNLFDGDSATAWVEGVDGPGRGEWIIFSAGQELPAAIMIRNGYQKSTSLFEGNARIKSASLSLYAGFHIEGESTEAFNRFYFKNLLHGDVISFGDKSGDDLFYFEPFCDDNTRRLGEALQEFKETFKKEIDTRKELTSGTRDVKIDFNYFIKLEVIDVYPGSQYEDLCLSEIDLRGVHHCRVPAAETVTGVYQDEASGKIRFSTGIRDSLIMLDMKMLPEYKNLPVDQQMSVVLMDVSDDTEWAQVNYQFALSEGRTEEYSTLWHVKSRSRINSRLLDKGTLMYGFTITNGRVLLETNEGSLILSPLGELIYYK
ncbi:MAG: hypothetical protein LC649_02320 [Bacteroidales bacterium]|nr:hypothetical protein [Bacteroidales bacterium]